jgi:hypothetical protein
MIFEKENPSYASVHEIELIKVVLLNGVNRNPVSMRFLTEFHCGGIVNERATFFDQLLGMHTGKRP